LAAPGIRGSFKVVVTGGTASSPSDGFAATDGAQVALQRAAASFQQRPGTAASPAAAAGATGSWPDAAAALHGGSNWLGSGLDPSAAAAAMGNLFSGGVGASSRRAGGAGAVPSKTRQELDELRRQLDTARAEGAAVQALVQQLQHQVRWRAASR
jgi:hypothetical protein